LFFKKNMSCRLSKNKVHLNSKKKKKVSQGESLTAERQNFLTPQGGGENHTKAPWPGGGRLDSEGRGGAGVRGAKKWEKPVSEAEKGRGSEQQTQPMCPPLSNQPEAPLVHPAPTDAPLPGKWMPACPVCFI
jgi:hypothetical protein